MKNLKVTIEQKYTNKKGTELNTSLKLAISQINEGATKEQIIGTCLSEIFAYLELQKNVGSKAIKLNQPLILTIEAEGLEIINFGILDINTIMKLKAGNKAKAKRNFAIRIVHSLNYMIRERKVYSVKELISELDLQISE